MIIHAYTEIQMFVLTVDLDMYFVITCYLSFVKKMFYQMFKVILYSYLILKKMNERITDS